MPGLSTKRGRVNHGGHSGYQAIGIPVDWGARRGILLGYDMQLTGGKTHYHGDHAGDLPNPGALFPEWIQRMNQLAADLRRQGIEVQNASRQTALTCFPRARPDEVLLAVKDKLLVHGMHGLGDNIYQRSVIRELVGRRDVYLETPWPQLYADLPIRCVKPVSKLRTQARNAARSDIKWHLAPAGVAAIRPHYVGSKGTMLQGLCDAYGVNPQSIVFDLPQFPRPDIAAPYIVIRPATIRTEWRADSRNPLPEYLAMAAEKLREHFRIISVADLAPNVEWPVLPLPYADQTYHAGELTVEQLLGMVAGAAAVVGGVGWLVPAALATRVPMLLIFGGWGLHNGPNRILDPRIDTSRIHQAIPQRFCMCGIRDHACDKRIADIAEQLDRWIVGLVAKRPVAVATGAADRLVPGLEAAV